MARPSKYTPETADKVCEGIRLGLTYALAAAYAGISWDTLDRWRKRKTGFAERVAEAEAIGAAENMQRIRNGARDDWRAAAWIMEHRHGYSAKTDLSLSGEVNGAIQIVGIEIPRPPAGES